jgi:hypothetical protein
MPLGDEYEDDQVSEVAKNVAANLGEHTTLNFKGGVDGLSRMLQWQMDNPFNRDREEWRLAGFIQFNLSEFGRLQVVPGVDLEFVTGLAVMYLASHEYYEQVVISKLRIVGGEETETIGSWMYTPDGGLEVWK